MSAKQVGLEGDLVDDADDAADFAGRLLDALHRGNRLLHHFAGLFGVAAGGLDGFRRDLGIVGAGIDLRGQLIERGRRLFQACGLLFGAVRQVVGGVADFAGAGADIDDRGVDRLDRLFEALHGGVEVALQLGIFAGEIVGDAIGKIAGGELRQPLGELGDDLALGGVRLGAFGFGLAALLFRMLALVLRFRFQALGIGKLVAEAFERLGDGAGLVGAVLAGDRRGVEAAAEVLDIADEAGERLLDEAADRDVEAEKNGAEHDQAADDHHVGLVDDRRVDGRSAERRRERPRSCSHRAGRRDRRHARRSRDRHSSGRGSCRGWDVEARS